MQNFVSAEGDITRLLDGINHYILRSCDGTPVSKGTQKLFMYAKIGPIVLITTIKPHSINNMHPSTRVKIKGKIPTVQIVQNTDIS